jgi:hypothetical protein
MKSCDVLGSENIFIKFVFQTDTKKWGKETKNWKENEAKKVHLLRYNRQNESCLASKRKNFLQCNVK